MSYFWSTLVSNLYAVTAAKMWNEMHIISDMFGRKNSVNSFIQTFEVSQIFQSSQQIVISTENFSILCFSIILLGGLILCWLQSQSWWINTFVSSGHYLTIGTVRYSHWISLLFVQITHFHSSLWQSIPVTYLVVRYGLYSAAHMQVTYFNFSHFIRPTLHFTLIDHWTGCNKDNIHTV
jgi:hypothetical protein